MTDRFAVHVVYYQDRKAALLRECVLPAAIELSERPGVQRLYVERHWLHGPQVRICVHAESPSVREQVERDFVPRIRAWLEQHPSTTALDEGRYLALSQTLGTRELVPPPYGPLWKDNTVFAGDHAARADLLGNPRVVEATETFYGRALRPVLAFLEAAGDNDSARLSYGMHLLTLMAASYPKGGLFPGHLSLRSHLEDYLFDHDRQGKLRAAFSEKYGRVRPAVLETLRKLAADTSQGRYTGEDPLLQQWSRLFEWGMTEGLELSRARQIVEDPTALMQAAAARVNEEARKKWEFGDQRDYSEFHTVLRGFNFLEERVDVVEFSAYRWLLNLLYTVLTLLDISPVERWYLNYVISESIEALFGRTWKEHFEKLRKRYLPEAQS
ncbi:MAG: lantibiotic dehydratase C-terminal domain-containing protein [Hyalangium sp.]|uniref:lantibiotic dehydratase C-terminal domain-containing protein n=1 Tax=Hyalangium sp. TaxID=2028555 RepID=UPI00389A1CF7